MQTTASFEDAVVRFGYSARMVVIRSFKLGYCTSHLWPRAQCVSYLRNGGPCVVKVSDCNELYPRPWSA